MAELLEIDGSVLEGGGQILRMSISLSAILGIPVRVTQVRAGRKKPGLAPQHLMGIKLVADMCQAKLKGARIGSTEIEFIPGKIRGGHYVADTQTAGSISLLLQVALPCALLADGPVTLDLKGGTNADMAPQLDYMYHVFRPMLQRFKADFSLTIHSRGYYPKGGGHVTVNVQPVHKFEPVQAAIQGTPVKIFAYSFVSPKLPTKIAYQMADAAKEQVKDKCSDIEVVAVKEDKCYTNDFCSGIILSASLSNGCTLGADGLFKRGVTPEDLGRSTGESMRTLIEAGVNVDSRMQDQVILFMALADGASVVTAGEDVTLHTKTAIHIAEMIAKTKFKLTYHDNKCDIECDGIGFVNKNIPE